MLGMHSSTRIRACICGQKHGEFLTFSCRMSRTAAETTTTTIRHKCNYRDAIFFGTASATHICMANADYYTQSNLVLLLTEDVEIKTNVAVLMVI